MQDTKLASCWTRLLFCYDTHDEFQTWRLSPVLLFILSSFPLQVIDMLPVLVVHGGAGHIPEERAKGSTAGVCAAARAGYAVFQRGGSSMDAVVEAVTQLENNPSFNAGTLL